MAKNNYHKYSMRNKSHIMPSLLATLATKETRKIKYWFIYTLFIINIIDKKIFDEVVFGKWL